MIPGAPSRRDEAHAFNFWAFDPEDPSTRQRDLRRENYHLLMQVAGTHIYFDGIRVTWEAHELNLWLASSSAPEIRQGSSTDEDAIVRIVRASLDLPFP